MVLGNERFGANTRGLGEVLGWNRDRGAPCPAQWPLAEVTVLAYSDSRCGVKAGLLRGGAQRQLLLFHNVSWETFL